MTASSARRGVYALRAALVGVVALLVVTLVAACGTGSATSSADGPHELNVFAAASLTEAFTELGERFTAEHPGVTVAFNFAGSNDLVTQLQQGAPADVLATADAGNMEEAASLTGAPQAFAGNELVIAVEPGNPEGISGLADLAGEDLKVVLAAPEVPAGKYAQEALAKAGVTVQPVSLEVSVKGVVTKVSLGEADAGIVVRHRRRRGAGQDRRDRDPRGPERRRHVPHRDPQGRRGPGRRAGVRRPRPLRRGPGGPRRVRVPAGAVMDHGRTTAGGAR